MIENSWIAGVPCPICISMGRATETCSLNRRRLATPQREIDVMDAFHIGTGKAWVGNEIIAIDVVVTIAAPYSRASGQRVLGELNAEGHQLIGRVEILRRYTPMPLVVFPAEPGNSYPGWLDRPDE